MMRKMSLGEEDKVEEKRDDEMDEESSSSFGDSQHFERQLSFSFHRSQLLSLSENPLTVTAEPNDQIPVLPCDIVVHQIGSFVNDPQTLYSMACVSRAWSQGLRNNLLSSPVIWQRLYSYRWMRSLSVEASSRPSLQQGTGDDQSETNWKRMYRQRHSRDKAVLQLVREVASTELNQVQLESRGSRIHNTQHQSSLLLESVVIRHARWTRLMGNHNSATRRRYWMMDVLCAIANQEEDYLSMLGIQPNMTATTTAPWERFLAASAMFQFHCHEVTRHMSDVMGRAAHLMSSSFQPASTTFMSAPYSFSSLYEEMAIILAHAMRPVPEVLQRSASLSQLRTTVQQQLSTMTQRVLQFIQYYCKTSARSPHHAHYGCSCRDPRVILYTIHYVMTKQYRLTYQPLTNSPLFDPLHAAAANGGEQALAACSISKVLTTSAGLLQGPGTVPQQQQQPGQCPCHPVLFAIIFQGIARRMGVHSDIVTCCSRNCRAMLRVPVPSIATPPPSPPRSPHSHTHQLFSSPKPPPLRPNWFVDLQQGPGNILTTTMQCQEWLEQHCQEQQYPPTPTLPQLDSPPRNVAIVPDDDDDDDSVVEGRQQQYLPRRRHPLLHPAALRRSARSTPSSFWSQPPMKLSSMVSWLVTPLLPTNHHGEREDVMDSLQDPPEPHQVLLQHLLQRVENNTDHPGDDLLALLQDRVLLFPSVLNYCQVTEDESLPI